MNVLVRRGSSTLTLLLRSHTLPSSSLSISPSSSAPLSSSLSHIALPLRLNHHVILRRTLVSSKKKPISSSSIKAKVNVDPIEAAMNSIRKAKEKRALTDDM